MINFNKKENPNDPVLVKQRNYVHFGFSIVMLLVILVFKLINDDSVVNAIFTAASYTYGPLLGLFVVGIATKYAVKDKLVPFICVLSPAILYILKTYVIEVYTPYVIGLDLIIINGFITFVLLILTSPGKASDRALSHN